MYTTKADLKGGKIHGNINLSDNMVNMELKRKKNTAQ